MRLSDLAWTEVDGVAADLELMLPLGSLEQHGPHLPLDTDTVIVAELARRWAATFPDRLVAPVIPVGASGEHSGFPGTLSIGTAVTAKVIVEVVRSAGAFRGVVVASWHGGNHDALDRANEVLAGEGRAVRFWRPRAEGDAHAGRVETSMMLAITPERVNLAAAEAGVTEPLSSLMPALRAFGVQSVSPNGVLGDPSGANPAEGDGIIERILDRFERDGQ